MKCENYKQYNVLCQTCDYPNKITCNKTFEENTKMQEDVVMKDEFMELSKKDKSKILVKHLERDFELVSRCGETYVIMSVMDALSEIESLEAEDN